ncbi:hypothetical protein NGM99_11895 [Mesorhizobium sp. RP14(2022)]|uniref:DUF6894 domain-containing protein n=1 Tax=Mesorhizobium liriopis TaxID=2953882 RepID=A0ABT1C7L9_9HYPH|nr:hypothetical protein [Mesorhizobium liriopis]MCO6050483.1 hypothetical protein [Mesorhizobium liriopis]
MAPAHRTNAYFFHVRHGRFEPDEEGRQVPSREEARREALKQVGDMLAEAGTDRWDGNEWQMFVTDENDRVTCTISISVEDR